MSGKRQATSDLNHDNWDRDEEPEDRGMFRTATTDELKNRVIKKARRKIAPGTASSDAADGGTATKSIFSGFSGFGKPAPTTATTAASPFSFLSKIPAASAGSTTGGIVSSSTTTTSSTPTFSFGSGTATTAAKTTESSTTSFSFGNTAASPSSVATATKTTSFSFSSSAGSSAKPLDNEDKKDTGDSKSSEYYGKLKGLNQAVSEWIKTHVDKNPLCILTPIFKDYEKYLKELEGEKNKAESKTTIVTEKSPATASGGGIGSFKFSGTSPTTTPSIGATSSTTESAAKTNGFSFGLKKPEENTAKPAAATGFSFGLKSSTDSFASPTSSLKSTPSSGFTFGKPSTTDNSTAATSDPKPFSLTPGGVPFSFGNIQPPAAASTTTSADNDDEEDEPPKNEFKQVVEEDAVYSKKCKVFVKKDGNFVDKGVGTLYLKPIESSGKTQLIVRADTNLGNILVNLILSSAIPSQRMGKTNVMMVCLPTPEVDKPTSMLLRVKTSEEADELLENIDKYKK